jgi:hypothetical protein
MQRIGKQKAACHCGSRDRRSPLCRVELRKFAIEVGEHLVNDASDQLQRVMLGHPLFFAQDVGAVLEYANLAYLAAAAALGNRHANRRFVHIQSDVCDIVHQARPP